MSVHSILSELTIGNVRLNVPLLLAPMSGVTTSSFRRLIKTENPECVGLMVSEFISVEALTRLNTRSIEMLRFASIERPIGVQVFGYDVDRMVQAACMVNEAGADLIDINCGCPVPKVVKRGGGCELMRQPEQLEKIINGIIKAGITIPLTVKMRAGWDDKSKNAVEIARRAVGCGAQMITVHSRTKKQMYSGEIDYSVVEEVCKAVDVPVIGSGDVVDITGMKRYYDAGVKGIMIGRGALGNPWVFSRLVAEASGVEWSFPAESEVFRVIKQYAVLLREELPEKAVIGRLKQFATQVTKQLRSSRVFRRDLCHSKTVDEFFMVIDRWPAYRERSVMIDDEVGGYA